MPVLPMSTPGLFDPRRILDAIYPKPQPGIVPLPPRQFRPQAPPPTIGPMPTIPEEAALRQPPSGFTEVPGGFNPDETVPGNIRYGGPQLNTEAALAGLAGSSASPLLDIQRIAGGMNPGGGAFRGGVDEKAAAPFNKFVSDSLAPQRASQTVIESAGQAQHPAVRALAQTTAMQKALPAQATASGMIESADLSADARIKEAMINAMQDQRQSAATAQGNFTDLLGQLMQAGYQWNDLSPEQQQLAIRAMSQLGNLNTQAGF